MSRATNLETVFRISQAVGSSLQVNVVLNRVLDVVQKILSADAVAAVAIHDPEGAPVAGLGRTRALFDSMRNVRQPIAADHRGYSGFQ